MSDELNQLNHTLEIVKLYPSFPGGNWIISQCDKASSGRAGTKGQISLLPFQRSYKSHFRLIPNQFLEVLW